MGYVRCPAKHLVNADERTALFVETLRAVKLHPVRRANVGCDGPQFLRLHAEEDGFELGEENHRSNSASARLRYITRCARPSMAGPLMRRVISSNDRTEFNPRSHQNQAADSQA